MKKALAYLRVSSEEQGKSGFGLQSQQTEIKAFAQAAGYRIVRWKSEVASAIGGETLSHRPGLLEILEEAKRKGLPVIISRLDRLSRDAMELEDLAGKSGVEFISIREAMADPIVLKVQAQRIAGETKLLSRRTKEGLERAKRQGRVLGNTTNLPEAQMKGAAANRRKAELRRLELLPVIGEIQASGARSARAIADALNQRSVPTSSGKPWTGPNVRTILNSTQESERLTEEGALEDRYKDDPLWGIF